MFLPCRPCCGAALAPCPPVPEDITAVEVDLRWSGSPFKLYSSNGDGEVVLEINDLSSWTGTYSLAKVASNRWQYDFAPRSDSAIPHIFYISSGNALFFYNPPSVFAKEYNGVTYDTFETCWDPANPQASGYSSACSRTWPLAAFNAGIVMGQFGVPTDLTGGSGGSAQARRCDGTGIDFIGWTSAGRTGDPRVYIDDLRIFE